MAENKIHLTPGTHYESLIEQDMQDSYLKYSMSVIVARALPDVRDGLKPVHRRVLFAMHELGLLPEKPTVKSARIVGEVIGKYHPHGDSAAYETLVRMAQDFSLRYPLVTGQGNFGSIDGDSAAAMRYTEANMSRFGEMMLEDLDKDTVDMGKNFDETLDEPLVLPAAFPNLLVNGSVGIAVGMSTSIPPHNLREIVRAIHAYCENNEITGEELLNYVSGPDFPTGGIICGKAGIRDAYLTGRGKIRVRARVEIEKDANGREHLIISEIPYMVKKALLVKNIADLVRDKRIDGISDIRDESTREIRVIVDIKRDFQGDIVLNNLFKYTQLQETFSVYNLALVNRTQPTLLTLKDMIRHYVDHRLEVVLRRTQFELKKAQARMHILEALRVACQNIDEVVSIIRGSGSTDEAKRKLSERFSFDDIQAQAIVDMQLKKLTGLELEKLESEYHQLEETIRDLEDIVARKERRVQIVLDSLDAIVEKYGDERRTSIEAAVQDYDSEDLIPEEEQVITLSREGYIKRLPIDTFKAQNRGGKGIVGAGLKDEDNIQTIFTASTHSYLLIFTNMGRVHWTKVYLLPEGSRNGKGRPIVNYVNLMNGEKVSAIVPVRQFGGYNCLVFATKNGVINKMDLKVFSNPRRAGVNAITLDEGDELVKVVLVGVTAEQMEAAARGEEVEYADLDVSEGEDSESEAVEETLNSKDMAADLLMIATKKGQALTFPISGIRTMGRGTHGVRGIRLGEGDEVIALLWLKADRKVLTISENGYGKRSEPVAYRITRRGGKGVRNLNITEKTGEAVYVESVADDYDLIITSREGQVIRIPVNSIRLTGRVSQGVKAITLAENDKVQDAAALPSNDDIDKESVEAQAEAEKNEGNMPMDDSTDGDSEG